MLKIIHMKNFVLNFQSIREIFFTVDYILQYGFFFFLNF